MKSLAIGDKLSLPLDAATQTIGCIGRIVLTDKGRAAAEQPQIELTPRGLQREVLAKLGGPERRLLEPLLKRYPHAMSNEVLAQGCGVFRFILELWRPAEPAQELWFDRISCARHGPRARSAVPGATIASQAT